MLRDCRGKTQACRSGASRPKSDGPISTPAIISATTGGWPTRAPSQATPRQAARISASWRKKRAESSTLDISSHLGSKDRVEPEPQRAGGPQRGEGAARDVVGVEELERAAGFRRVEHRTEDEAARALPRLGDEHRLAREVPALRGGEDHGALRLVPARVDELVEELAPGTAGGGEAEHPQLAAGALRAPGVDGGEVGGTVVSDRPAVADGGRPGIEHGAAGPAPA